jgi:hypothetical protein
MAALAPVFVVADITNSGTSSNTINAVNKFGVTWKLGAPEDISYTATGPGVTHLTPGTPPPGTRIITISLDNGATALARMLSGGSQIDDTLPMTASEQGASIGQALATTMVDRQTAQQIPLQAVFTGILGQVVANSGGLVTPGDVLPTFAGIGAVPIGATANQQAALAFTFVVDGAIATLPLDIDINRDSLLRIVQTVVQNLGAIVDPQQAQFVIDSGDYGVAGAAPRTVTLGHKGQGVTLTFSAPTDGSAPSQPVLRGSIMQPQTLQMCYAAAFKGGDTHHGLPDTGKITDIVTINHAINDATGDWRAGLPILAVYGDAYHGGVYYDPGDDTLHPWSQAMGVTCLAYSEANETLYAATDAGVYTHSADLLDTSPWQRLGGLVYRVLKVVAIPDVYCLVEEPKTTTRHVLKFNPAAQAGYGWDDWQAILSGDGIFDVAASVGYAGDPTAGLQTVLYTLSTAYPGKVGFHNVTTPANVDPQLAIPTIVVDGQTVQPVGIGLDGLDPLTPFSLTTPLVSAGVFVRTDSGSAALFFIDTSHNVLNTMANVGANLADAFGNPVMVNCVRRHHPGLLKWGYAGGPASNPSQVWTAPVAVLAGTSAGVFTCATAGVPWNWQYTGGQNNLGDVNVLKVASAPPRLWLFSQWRSPVYGIADRSYYKSYNGTINWDDALSQPLDAGPAFFDWYRGNAANYPGRTGLASGKYPDNTTAVVQYPDPNTGPYLVQRSLSGLGGFAYRMVAPSSAAPAGQQRNAEITQISTPALVPAVEASYLLLDAMARFLWYTSRAQEILQIESYATDTTDPLLSLRPTQLVQVNGTLEMFLADGTEIVFKTYSNAQYYVLEHTISFDAEQDPHTIRTSTKLGKLLLDDRSDPLKVSADRWYAVSRQQLYRSRSRH